MRQIFPSIFFYQCHVTRINHTFFIIWWNYIIFYPRNLRKKRYSLFYLLTVTPNVKSDVCMKIVDRRAPKSSVCLMRDAFVVRSAVENKWEVTTFSDSRATFNNRLVFARMRSLIRFIFICLRKKVCLDIKSKFKYFVASGKQPKNF